MVEICQLNTGTAGGGGRGGGGWCSCRHSDTQVSKGQEWGFRSERDSTLEAARSLLFIEVDERIVDVMTHVCPTITKSWEV